MKRFSVRTSSVHGKGVFALRKLMAGERLVEYKGTVVSWHRASRAHEVRGTSGHTFLFGLSDGSVIDGSQGGNSARWINHACDANCVAVEDDGRVYIEATRDIDSGEELFIAYALSIEGRLTKAVRREYACRCKSPRCRGTMLAVR